MSMESMGIRVERMASGSNIMEKHGIGSNTQPKQCKGSGSEMGTHQVFDERPSSQGGFDLNTDRVLSVSVHHMLYPVTLKVLHQVFDPYGVVEKIVTAYKPGNCQVFVQYKADQQATHALGALHGRCIYDGCCQLDIQCMQESEWQMYSVACGTSSDPSYVMNKIKEIPKFDGTNLNGWLEDCEAFFEILKLHPVLWIIAAERSMIGDAILWSQAFSTRYGLVSWEDFRAALCEEFGQFTNQRLVEHIEKNPDEKPQVQKEVQNCNDGELVHVYLAQVQDSVHAPRVFDKMQLESDGLRNKCKLPGPLSSWKEEPIMGLQQQDSSTTKVRDDGKPQELPSQEHFMAWLRHRLDGLCWVLDEMPPWSRSAFSPGNAQIESACWVLEKMPSWRRSGFSPGSEVTMAQIILQFTNEDESGENVDDQKEDSELGEPKPNMEEKSGLAHQEEGKGYPSHYVLQVSLEKVLEPGSEALHDGKGLESDKLDQETEPWEYDNTAEAAKAISAMVKFLWYAMEPHLLQMLACLSVSGFVGSRRVWATCSARQWDPGTLRLHKTKLNSVCSKVTGALLGIGIVSQLMEDEVVLPMATDDTDCRSRTSEGFATCFETRLLLPHLPHENDCFFF